MGGLPDLLTIEEAAKVIRVGRTKAYAMAREWRTTGGKSGLPVIDFGHALRVPLCQLETIVGGPLTAERVPGDAPATLVELPMPRADEPLSDVSTLSPSHESAQTVTSPAIPDSAPSPKRAPRRRTRTPDQPTLPFAD